jgi:hypothetical protein
LDTDKNVLAADGREILIDEELAKQINFIREGQFDEVDGAPALKLIGEVKPVNVIQDAQAKLVPKAISQEDILSAFLDQNAVAEPLEYIRAAVRDCLESRRLVFRWAGECDSHYGCGHMRTGAGWPRSPRRRSAIPAT